MKSLKDLKELKILEDLKELKILQDLKELGALQEVKERVNVFQDVKANALQEVKGKAKAFSEKHISNPEKLAAVLAIFFAGIIIGMLISPKGDRAYGCDNGNTYGGGCDCGCDGECSCKGEKEETEEE